MTHPHHDIIKKWLTGTAVQYLEDGVWKDMEPYATCDKLPHFYRSGTYRAKPITHRFKVGTLGGRLCVVSNLEGERQGNDRGAEWLTDWQEVTR